MAALNPSHSASSHHRISGILLLFYCCAAWGDLLPFRNTSKSIEERLEWLVDNLNLNEKLGLLGSKSSAIPRLAIKPYMTYVECNSGAYANGAMHVQLMRVLLLHWTC